MARKTSAAKKATATKRVAVPKKTSVAKKTSVPKKTSVAQNTPLPKGKFERNPERDDDVGEGASIPEEILERQSAERLEEIRQYLADRYARRDVIMRTRTPGGIEIDWVPVESQRGWRPADPPDEDSPPRLQQGERRAELVTFELETKSVERGPRGTVPLLHTPIDRITSTASLNDWLAKGIRANRVPPAGKAFGYEVPGTDVHKHVYATQSVTCYGTEGNINAWDPYTNWSDEFSLGQLWLVRGSGTNLQTLEVGCQEYRDKYGDWVPHLFTFFTTNGYTKFGKDKDTGKELGGYNTEVGGWQQYASTIHPGSLCTPLSQSGGTQYIMALKIQLWQGNWWVKVNGTWIGFYPASLYDTTGLRDYADQLLWGGEVVDSDGHAGTTSTDMGNGHWPYEGWQHCAYMSNLRYQSTTEGAMSDFNGTALSEFPACYGIESHMLSGSSWGSYFWWGGSGKNANCP